MEKLKKDDFEIYMRGPTSPSKRSKRFHSKDREPKYEPESLIPANYEEQLVQKKLEEDKLRGSVVVNSKDPFKCLGVSNEDKMTYFLLKWVFNAIKRESAIEDTKLQGKPYVTKVDLIKQLGKNDELMTALGYEGPEQVARGVKDLATTKDGSLLWEEFLDFFFLRQGGLRYQSGSQEHWWRRIGQSETKQDPRSGDEDEAPKKDSPAKKVPRYGASQGGSSGMPYNYEDPDKKPVKMTETLRMLQETRRGKVTQEVEDEFKALQ